MRRPKQQNLNTCYVQRKYSHLQITSKILMIKLDFTQDYLTLIYLLQHSTLFPLM